MSVYQSVTKDVVEFTARSQIPWMNSSLTADIYLDIKHEQNLTIKHGDDRVAENNDNIEVDTSVLSTVSMDKFSINGVGAYTATDGMIYASSLEVDSLRPGLNTINAAGRSVLAWYEKQRLRAFENPYRESYAIIVAIDNYNEDAQKLAPLGEMVPNAKKLARVLAHFGFPTDHIIELYNEQATTEKIEATFRSFGREALSQARTD